MARINIEDSIYRDIRFHDLIQKLGGTDAALGSLVRAWSVAQDYWLINGVGIPKPVWKSQRLRPELIEVGLAEERGDFIYTAGSEEQFAWLTSCSEKGKKGGPAAAKRRRENIEKSGRPKSSQIVPDRPLTLPLSLSQENTKQNKEAVDVKIRRAHIQALSQTWKETLEHFGHSRNLSAKEQRLIALVLVDESAELVDQALFGARFEPRTEKFDPGKAPDIVRVVGDRDFKKPSQVAKFAGYGKGKEAAEGWGAVKDAI